MFCDFFDGFGSRIPILTDDKKPCFWWSIDDIYGDIWVFLTDNREIFSEPVFFFLESVWRVDIDGFDVEISCEHENLVKLFF